MIVRNDKLFFFYDKMPSWRIIKFAIMKLIIVLFLTAILTPAQAAGPEKCRVERNGDTLRIANNRIERAFLWNDGNLQTLSLSDLSTGSRLLAQGDPEPDFSIGDFKPAGAAIEQLVIGEDDRTPACLVVRISFSLGRSMSDVSMSSRTMSLQ